MVHNTDDQLPADWPSAAKFRRSFTKSPRLQFVACCSEPRPARFAPRPIRDTMYSPIPVYTEVGILDI